MCVHISGEQRGGVGKVWNAGEASTSRTSPAMQGYYLIKTFLKYTKLGGQTRWGGGDEDGGGHTSMRLYKPRNAVWGLFPETGRKVGSG